jgi:indoleamine 2,3-dioxygenase
MTIETQPSPEGNVSGGHAFDVDSRTGFMPPKPPIARLPATWEDWEAALDLAFAAKLKCGDHHGLTPDDAANSEAWRAQVRKVCPLSLIRHLPIVLRCVRHVSQPQFLLLSL